MTGLFTAEELDYTPNTYAFFEGVSMVVLGESVRKMAGDKSVIEFVTQISDKNHDATQQGKSVRVTLWEKSQLAFLAKQSGMSRESLEKYGPNDESALLAKLVGSKAPISISAGKPTADGRIYCQGKPITKEDYEKSVAAGTHFRKIVRPEENNGKSTTVTATTF